MLDILVSYPQKTSLVDSLLIASSLNQLKVTEQMVQNRSPLEEQNQRHVEYQ